MKTMQMPASYAVLTTEEQQGVLGGGELGDALSTFFGNLHLDNFFFGNALFAFSFTFVPVLLFNVIAAGFDVFKTVSRNLSALFGLREQAAQSLALVRTSAAVR